uniref:Glucosylceramidase n=1 Tax=Ditylenchus dipsaci TaxID=166011 RepID=A0A915D8V7_9BILA
MGPSFYWQTTPILFLFVALLHTSGAKPTEPLKTEIDAQALQNAQDDSNVIGWEKKECIRKWFPHPNTTRSSSFVCVCTASNCDEPEPFSPQEIEGGQKLVYYITTKDEHRLHRRSVDFGLQASTASSDVEKVEIVVDSAQTYQTIFGEPARENLYKSYFDKQTGINYNVGRVPMASCDFSTHEYSYLDKQDDFSLESFALAPEDLELKIPHLLKAMNYSQNQLQLFASPWSAPGWMKTNGRMKDGYPLKGEINGKYYETYAKYFRRFFEDYFKQGIKFWGLTMQNEPRTVDWPWQTMTFNYEMQREFAHGLLSPELKKSEVTSNIKIMGCDDNRGVVLQAAKEIYSDEEKAKAIDGMATHWYDHADFGNLTAAHNVRPDKFILASEACNGDAPWEHTPLLGDWHRGVMYAHDILHNLRNWVVGWTDWNICLDLQGGPNWANNFVDAPIIVNKTSDEFYKQPMFYAMGHFSKFVTVESLIEHVAFTTPEGHRVLVLTNIDESQNRTVEVTIRDVELAGKAAKIVVQPHSIVTAVWSATVVRR